MEENFMFIIIILSEAKFLKSLLSLFWCRQSFDIYLHYFDEDKVFKIFILITILR